MNRRDPITKADVQDAIAELIINGIDRPACRAVREQLGGGSMTTITKLMREIEGDRMAASVSAVALTPAQAARVNTTIESLLSELRRDDQFQIDRLKRECEERVAEANWRAEELAEAVDAEQQISEERQLASAQERDELRRAEADVRYERDRLHSTLAQERTTRVKAEEMAALLRDDCGLLRQRLEGFVAAVAAARQQLDGAANLLSERDKEIGGLRAQIEQMERQIGDERIMRGRAEEKIQRLVGAEAALLEQAAQIGRLESVLAWRRPKRPRQTGSTEPTEVS